MRQINFSDLGIRAVITQMLIHSFSNSNIQTPSRWELDLGVSITSAEGETLRKDCAVIPNSVRCWVLQLNILHKVYITPSRRFFFFLFCSGMVVDKRECRFTGYGPALQSSPFGQKCFHWISGIMNSNLSLCHVVGLLGERAAQLRSNKDRRMFGLDLLAAK